MKKLLSFLFLLNTILLCAQIQVLPDIEVSGESQIKIFLYKKALPYSFEGMPGDSLRAFIPESLPPQDEAQALYLRQALRHFIHAQASTRMKLDADYRYISPSPGITSLGLGMSLYAPKGNLLSNHFHGSGNFLVPSGEDMAANLRLYNSDGGGINSEYGSADLHVYKDHYEFSRFELNKVSTGFGLFGIKQTNRGVGMDHWAMNLSHQSEFKFTDFSWGNVLLLSTDNSAWQSYLDTDISGFDKASLNLIYDGENFLPIPGFLWRYITDFDQQISIGNNPHIRSADYAVMLEKYRWVFLRDKSPQAVITTVPIDLSFRMEDFMPISRDSFIRRYALENRTQFRINEGIVGQSNNPDIPQIHYDEVFSNISSLKASFGQGSFIFEQSFALHLSYLNRQSWVRLPYDPLLSSESSLRYQAYPYTIEAFLNQRYFAIDDMRSDLPEVFDFSLGASYDFGRFDQLYLRLENLLNSDIRPYRSLPKKGFSINVGIHHRF